MSTETATSPPTMRLPISPRLLPSLFTSLSSTSAALPREWHLRRILRSDNPTEINGELKGIATFQPLQPPTEIVDEKQSHTAYAPRQMVYKEEGEMPSSVRGMAGLRWTKKYIWRLNNTDQSPEMNGNDVTSDQSNPTSTATERNEETGGISVWFVKIKSGRESNQGGLESQDEPDYLFHEFDFGKEGQENQQEHKDDDKNGTKSEIVSVEPPMPPLLNSSTLAKQNSETQVVQARGNHLCVKDMYYTAYSFRIVPETGEVLSWASRHIVKGPKKNQDIINLYSMEWYSRPL